MIPVLLEDPNNELAHDILWQNPLPAAAEDEAAAATTTAADGDDAAAAAATPAGDGTATPTTADDDDDDVERINAGAPVGQRLVHLTMGACFLPAFTVPQDQYMVWISSRGQRQPGPAAATPPPPPPSPAPAATSDAAEGAPAAASPPKPASAGSGAGAGTAGEGGGAGSGSGDKQSEEAEVPQDIAPPHVPMGASAEASEDGTPYGTAVEDPAVMAGKALPSTAIVETLLLWYIQGEGRGLLLVRC